MGAVVPASDLPDNLPAPGGRVVPADDLPANLPAAPPGAKPTLEGAPKPAWWPKGRAWPPQSELLSETGAAARGVAAGVLGLPGDIEALVNKGISGIGDVFPAAKPLSDMASKQGLPTSSDVEKHLPGASAAAAHPHFQQAGEIAGSIIGPGAAPKAAKLAGKAVGETADTVGRLLPGATARAQAGVADIAKPTDITSVGETIRQGLTRRLTRLWDERRTETDAARAAFIAKSDTKSGPVIRSYQDTLADIAYGPKSADLSPEETKLLLQSSKALAGERSLEAVDKEIRRLNDIATKGDIQGYGAISKLFAKHLGETLTKITSEEVPEYGAYRRMYKERSAPINLFTETTQGRRAVDEMSDLLPADVFKTDPAALPNTFFRTRSSVKLLEELAGGDKDFTEAAARAYVGTQLDAITQAAMRTQRTGILSGIKSERVAKAATDWFNKGTGTGDPPKVWLEEVPGARKAVADYVKELQTTAKTQEAAAYTAGAGALYALMSKGEHPWYWLRRLTGLE